MTTPQSASDATPGRDTFRSAGSSRHTVYGNGDPESAAAAIEWLRKQAAAARPAAIASVTSETEDYARGAWAHITRQLAGTDTERARLILTAVSIGSTAERAQTGYDVRRALAAHGPHGVGPYLREMATRLLDHPGQERRAGMLACLANAIDPNQMSDEYKQMHRRYWGLPPTPSPTAAARRSRPRR
jgi:hypothetical protein